MSLSIIAKASRENAASISSNGTQPNVRLRCSRAHKALANPRNSAPVLRGKSPPSRPWEAGTSWIGQSGGLAGSQANAQGFVDEWAAAGWHIDFNWGDANA